MNYTRLKRNLLTLWLVMILTGLLLSAPGCARFGKNSLILTTKDRLWIIPQGTSFKAVINDKTPLTEYIADDDLVVMYKGNLLELEKEANKRVIGATRSAKKQGALLGIIGSVLSIAAGLIGKGILKRKKE